MPKVGVSITLKHLSDVMDMDIVGVATDPSCALNDTVGLVVQVDDKSWWTDAWMTLDDYRGKYKRGRPATGEEVMEHIERKLAEERGAQGN